MCPAQYPAPTLSGTLVAVACLTPSPHFRHGKAAQYKNIGKNTIIIRIRVRKGMLVKRSAPGPKFEVSTFSYTSILRAVAFSPDRLGERLPSHVNTADG